MFSKDSASFIFIEPATWASVVKFDIKAFHDVESDGEISFGFGSHMREDFNFFPVDRRIAMFFVGR